MDWAEILVRLLLMFSTAINGDGHTAATVLPAPDCATLAEGKGGTIAGTPGDDILVNTGLLITCGDGIRGEGGSDRLENHGVIVAPGTGMSGGEGGDVIINRGTLIAGDGTDNASNP